MANLITWKSQLADLAQQQLPFALSRSINATLKQIQTAQREHQDEVFTVRRPAFVDRAVKIPTGGFATKRRLMGEIMIAGPNARVLAQHEAGGDKVPAGGGRLAIPRTGSLVKPRATSIVPRHLYPMALQRSLSLRTWVAPFHGDPSTEGIFAVDRVHEARLGVARGRGRVTAAQQRRAKPQLLYILEPEVHLTPRLGFALTASRITRERFLPNLQAAVIEALRTARPRS